MKRIFSTSDAQERDSFRRWREMLCDQFGALNLSRVGPQPFSATAEAMEVGSLLITRLSHTATRSEVLPGRALRQHDDTYVNVCIIQEGTGRYQQYDRDCVQNAGEIIVFDASPGVAVSGPSSRALNLRVPRSKFEALLGPVRLYSTVKLGDDLHATSLIRTFFNDLIRVHADLGPDAAARMSSIGVDLIVAGFAERLAQAMPGSLHGTVVVQRAKAHVEANLGDLDLDPPHLAAAVGVSLRRLQELFHERGQHVSEWIWHRRLEVAARRLRDKDCAHLSIGMLAYGCGFASQSHFTRRFKEHYGMTPSAFRFEAGPDPLDWAPVGGRTARD